MYHTVHPLYGIERKVNVSAMWSVIADTQVRVGILECRCKGTWEIGEVKVPFENTISVSELHTGRRGS